MTYAPLSSRVQVNNGETVRRLAIAGREHLARICAFIDFLAEHMAASFSTVPLDTRRATAAFHRKNS